MTYLARIKWLLTLCLLVVSAAQAQVREGDIVVIPQFDSVGMASVGYSGASFQVTNESPDTDHLVRIEAPENSYVRGGSLKKVQRSVLVPAGSSQVIALWLPPLPRYGSGASLYVDGRQAERSLAFNSSYNPSAPQTPVVLVSPGNPQCVQPNYTWVEMTHGGYGAPTQMAYMTAWQTELWSPHWLTYTQYAGIVVTGRELRAMPAGVREALVAWTEAGGVLVVTGEGTYPAHWQFEEADGGRRAMPGFGICFEAPGGDPKQWPNALQLNVKSQWSATAEAQARNFNIGEANNQFSVVENIHIPVRGLLVGMLLFVMLAGPANFALLIMKNKRMLFYATVPAISLVACLGIGTYSFLAEGWRGTLRTEVLTLLDQRSQQAVTLGWTAFYAPVTPSAGLRFSKETELSPMIERFGWSSDGTPHVVDWTEEQHLSEGWIAARIPAHFRVRKAEQRRERLVLRREGDRLSATNGLGAPIEELYVHENGGKIIYQGAAIAAGATGELAIGQPASHRKLDLREYFRLNTWNKPTEKMASWSGALPPGMYLARLSGSPFLEDGLGNPKKTSRVTVVLGYLDGEAGDAR